VAISDGSKSTTLNHQYVGTPIIDNVKISFLPVDTITVMPEITNVRISSITGFAVTVDYDVLNGSGSIKLLCEVN
jgi:uncharacterized protein YjdB